MDKNQRRKIIYVYADWMDLDGPKLMGTLAANTVRNSEIFSFSYDEQWLTEGHVQELDPDLQFFAGNQYTIEGKPNFGLFTDSCPDRWGRQLMKRREALLARKAKRPVETLRESDFLLGVYDTNRIGALRFKLDSEGPFLNDQTSLATPPWTRLRELEQTSLNLEENEDSFSEETLKWLNLLISPGSSLGGARPKASVMDEDNQLWIAKFPSHYDDTNVGGWEMVAYKVALDSGIRMPECRVQKFSNENYTFLTKRFDRKNGQRIHFASAMTCLGKIDGDNHASGVSYLDLAEFIVRRGSDVNGDLEELWKRIILNICISNVDDHLRNHGFLFKNGGWTLSPAYDINPVADGQGLNLNISHDDNSLDIALALSVAGHFRLDQTKAKRLFKKIKLAASKWREHADHLGISKGRQELMARAFRIAEL